MALCTVRLAKQMRPDTFQLTFLPRSACRNNSTRDAIVPRRCDTRFSGMLISFYLSFLFTRVSREFLFRYREQWGSIKTRELEFVSKDWP